MYTAHGAGFLQDLHFQNNTLVREVSGAWY
jgi:hypothetical protein